MKSDPNLLSLSRVARHVGVSSVKAARAAEGAGIEPALRIDAVPYYRAADLERILRAARPAADDGIESASRQPAAATRVRVTPGGRSTPNARVRGGIEQRHRGPALAGRASGIWPTRLEVRDRVPGSGGDMPKLIGYAAIFSSSSHPIYVRGEAPFRERIDPGAFARALASRTEDQVALLGHDWARPVGRRSRGTLELREDDRGLRVTVQPPNSTLGRDLVEAISRGDVEAMSFSFTVARDSWSTGADGMQVRTVHEVESLFEVSFVANPAYPASAAALLDPPAATPAASPAPARSRGMDLTLALAHRRQLDLEQSLTSRR